MFVKEAQEILRKAEKLPDDVSQWSSQKKQDIADMIQKFQGKIHYEENRAKGKNHAEKFFKEFQLKFNKEIVIFIMTRLCKHHGIHYKRGDIRYLTNAYNRIDDNWDRFYKGGLQELRIIKVVDEETLSLKGYRIDLFGNSFHTDDKGRFNLFKGRSSKIDNTKEVQEGLEQVRQFLESCQQPHQEVESFTTTNDIYNTFVSPDDNDNFTFDDSNDLYNDFEF